MKRSILDMVYDTAKDLHAAGVMKESTFRSWLHYCELRRGHGTQKDAEKNGHLRAKRTNLPQVKDRLCISGLEKEGGDDDYR